MHFSQTRYISRPIIMPNISNLVISTVFFLSLTVAATLNSPNPLSRRGHKPKDDHPNPYTEHLVTPSGVSIWTKVITRTLTPPEPDKVTIEYPKEYRTRSIETVTTTVIAWEKGYAPPSSSTSMPNTWHKGDEITCQMEYVQYMDLPAPTLGVTYTYLTTQTKTTMVECEGCALLVDSKAVGMGPGKIKKARRTAMPAAQDDDGSEEAMTTFTKPVTTITTQACSNGEPVFTVGAPDTRALHQVNFHSLAVSAGIRDDLAFGHKNADALAEALGKKPRSSSTSGEVVEKRAGPELAEATGAGGVFAADGDHQVARRAGPELAEATGAGGVFANHAAAKDGEQKRWIKAPNSVWMLPKATPTYPSQFRQPIASKSRPALQTQTLQDGVGRGEVAPSPDMSPDRPAEGRSRSAVVVDKRDENGDVWSHHRGWKFCDFLSSLC